MVKSFIILSWFLDGNNIFIVKIKLFNNRRNIKCGRSIKFRTPVNNNMFLF